MKIPKIPKVVKVAAILVVVVILASLAAAGMVALDVTGNFATGSEKLTPFGDPTEKALVVYDPGVSGAALDAATKIAGDLQSRGFDVTLAGVRSAAAANVTGYDVIVAGGPVYAGKVSSSIYAYLQGLKSPDSVKLGAFATGKYRSNDLPEQIFPGAVTYDAAAAFFPEEGNVSQSCAAFVAELLR